MEIKIVSWNVRGLGTEAKVTSVKRVIRKTRANLFYTRKQNIDNISGTN